MKVEVESGDWASRAAQETVRKHFATQPAVRLELRKEGQRPIAFTARTASLLAGSYNEFLTRAFKRAFRFRCRLSSTSSGVRTGKSSPTLLATASDSETWCERLMPSRCSVVIEFSQGGKT
jgi:hypothetical protein